MSAIERSESGVVSTSETKKPRVKKSPPVFEWFAYVSDVKRFLSSTLTNHDTALIAAGTLIALRDDAYRSMVASDDDFPQGSSGDEWTAAVTRVLGSVTVHESATVQEQLTHTLTSNAGLLSSPTRKTKFVTVLKSTLLDTFSRSLLDHALTRLEANDSFDFIGALCPGDNDSGIVLTPSHISELMVALLDALDDSEGSTQTDSEGSTKRDDTKGSVQTNPPSVVLDLCSGSGAFSIASTRAGHTPHAVEKSPDMYALLVANGIVRGWDLSGLRLGDVFDAEVVLGEVV